MKVQILHNPRCSKSRATLQVLEENGFEPEIILYQDAPPDVEQLTSILKQLNMQARDLMRKGQSEYKELGLETSFQDDGIQAQGGGDGGKNDGPESCYSCFKNSIFYFPAFL